MTPARRRPALPVTEDRSKLVGPDGKPVAQDAPAPAPVGDLATPTETGQVVPEDGVTTSPGRRRSNYPLPVWPD